MSSVDGRSRNRMYIATQNDDECTQSTTANTGDGPGSVI